MEVRPRGSPLFTRPAGAAAGPGDSQTGRAPLDRHASGRERSAGERSARPSGPPRPDSVESALRFTALSPHIKYYRITIDFFAIFYQVCTTSLAHSHYHSHALTDTPTRHRHTHSAPARALHSSIDATFTARAAASMPGPSGMGSSGCALRADTAAYGALKHSAQA